VSHSAGSRRRCSSSTPRPWVIALPEAATSYLLDELQCKKIVEVTIIEDVEGGIIFEAKADKVDYKFDWSGQLLIGDEIAIAPRK
jgi:hypothetical protein